MARFRSTQNIYEANDLQQYNGYDESEIFLLLLPKKDRRRFNDRKEYDAWENGYRGFAPPRLVLLSTTNDDDAQDDDDKSTTATTAYRFVYVSPWLS